MTLEFPVFLSLLLLIFAVAMLYASVGHGGASGYLAVMSFFSLAQATMKSSALMLNILVAGISFFYYWRKGHFNWNLFWPFAITSIPAAYLGSSMPLGDVLYKKILGVCLLLAVIRMVWQIREREKSVIPFNVFIAAAIGAAIGLLSGMIGIGGGIILTPVILLLGWAGLRETAAISALFILVNSISGLIAQIHKGYHPEEATLWMAAVAGTGGVIGAWLGSSVLKLNALRYVLAVGLFIAALKLLLL